VLLLAIAAFAAFLIDEWADPPRIISSSNANIIVADGDSFALGGQKIRLDGIDAPEYRQSCSNRSAVLSACGKAARTSLEQMLRQPGLTCKTDATDQYGRLIAVCSTSSIADVGAAQVKAGMAITHEYFGVRTYPDEEDSAEELKRGIWAGSFVRPSEWRDTATPRAP
jgi:endonuclease YncB( thermonuclease family)